MDRSTACPTAFDSVVFSAGGISFLQPGRIAQVGLDAGQPLLDATAPSRTRAGARIDIVA
jgi:hypothetical protein